jgi:4-amino-4-deoxy-L-arabinose transferase-like glycosyltransferase
LLCAIVLALSTKGITDESVVSMNGDMPKYLMNGVYFYDLLDDMPVKNPLEHAYRYFAQYPALSLGHHPLLLGVAEVPFYTVFGISVFSARLCIVFFMLISAIALYFLVRLIYGDTIALLASSLFVTSPFIVRYSRIVMPEIQAIALIILATYFLYKYCELDNGKYAIAAAFTLILSVFSKQHVIFIFPVFLLFLIIQKRPKSLFTKKLIIAYLIIIILILPLVFITLKFAKYNIRWVTSYSLNERLSLSNIVYFPKTVWRYHLSFPVLIFSLTSIIAFIWRRDKKIVFFLIWIISLYLLLTGLGLQKGPRYAIYWIPHFCVLAAAIINLFQNRSYKIFIITLLLTTVCYQFIVAYKMKPEYLDGYEKTAKYMTEILTEKTILFHGVNDTSYLIFFIRKYDTERNFIILRSCSRRIRFRI